MISVRHRFHGYGSLRTVYQRGQTVRGPAITLKYRYRGPQRQPYRVAVVVSRKVHKSAVVRNRIRRRLYEIVRQADQEMLAHQTWSSRSSATRWPHDQAELTALSRRLATKSRQGRPNTAQTPVRHDIVNKHRKQPDRQS